MTYAAELETDTGKRLSLSFPGGHSIGKAMFGLIEILELYCMDPSESNVEIRDWCMQLERFSRQSLCIVIQPLLSGWYIFTGEEDIESEAARKTGVPAQDLLASVSGLAETFRMAGLQEIPGASPQVIQVELDILKTAIEFALWDPVTKLRIVFL